MKQSNPLERFPTKNERFNEFPEKEIGVDYPLSSNSEIEVLSKAIFDSFKENSSSPYQIARSMPTIVESKTKYFKYSTKNNEQKTKLFIVSMRDRDGVISVKKKANKIQKDGVIIQDEIEHQLPDKQWTPELEQKIKLEQAKFFDISPEQIIRTSEKIKRKLKIRIENAITKRIYTIGITSKNKIGGKSKKSLSVDYVGSEVQRIGNNEVSTESEIIEDIKKIGERALSWIVTTS